jgi:hypothetical protein
MKLYIWYTSEIPEYNTKAICVFAPDLDRAKELIKAEYMTSSISHWKFPFDEPDEIIETEKVMEFQENCLF